MGMIRPSLRVFPDYSMQPQDVMLMLLTKHVEVTHAEINDSEDTNDMYSIYDPTRPGELQGRHWVDSVVADFRHDCINLAASWLPQLDSDENRISPRSVRRHLLKFLPLNSPVFDYKPGRTLQFKAYLWYKIPNERSMRWRLSRAGIVRLAHLLDRIKSKARYGLAGREWQFADTASMCD